MSDKQSLFSLAFALNKHADELQARLGCLIDRLIGPRPPFKDEDRLPQPSSPALGHLLNEAAGRLGACHELIAAIEDATGGQVAARERQMGGPNEMGGEGWPTGESGDLAARPYMARERR